MDLHDGIESIICSTPLPPQILQGKVNSKVKCISNLAHQTKQVQAKLTSADCAASVAFLDSFRFHYPLGMDDRFSVQESRIPVSSRSRKVVLII